MPIPKPETGELEEKYISRCISEIASEYDAEGQAYAICKAEFDKPTQMAAEDDEAAVWDKLPEPKKDESEDDYIERCLPSLYPELFDQQQAASYCGDHYGNIMTVGLKKQIMKAQPMSPFERKRLEFRIQLLQKELREKGIRLAEDGGTYEWDDCIADQTERYGDEETAAKVCGAIKAG